MCMNDNNKTIMVGVKNSSQYLSIGFELEQHLRCDKSNKKGRRRRRCRDIHTINVKSTLKIQDKWIFPLDPRNGFSPSILCRKMPMTT